MTVEELIRRLVMLPPEAMQKPVMLVHSYIPPDPLEQISYFDIDDIKERTITRHGPGESRLQVVVIE